MTAPARDTSSAEPSQASGQQPAGRLDRRRQGRPPAPVRIVHLGVGNFFRAHQAWYTEHAPDADGWGIAAFTGRSPAAAEALNEQQNLYTVLVRGPRANSTEVVSSLSAVHPGSDLASLRAYLSRSRTAVVTLTVTEAGYHRSADGGLDLTVPEVADDVAALAADPGAGRVVTAPGRLVAGLLARRSRDAGPIALVPCDNVPDNGGMLRRVVTGLAAAVDPSLVDWIEENVSFVTTMVDRITPRATPADLTCARSLTGVQDPEVVVTEPFSEWVLSGDFPAGRPAWEAAGAHFVADVHPYETRKLWLLNGAHSILAYGGSVPGHRTVAEAIADPRVAGWVRDWWDAASSRLELPAADIRSYRQALLERFASPGIQHLLSQIAADGSQKIPIRVLPVLRAVRADAQLPTGVTYPLAAWVAHLRGLGVPVQDVRAAELTRLAAGPAAEAVEAVLGWLGVDDIEVSAMVGRQLAELEELAGR